MSSTNESTQVTETQAIKYPSSQILLDTIKYEFEIEGARKRDLETRAGILIALSGALIGFYANTLDYSFAKEASTPFEYIIVIFLGLLYLLPLATLLYALWHFLKILDAQAYDRLNLNGFQKEVGQKNSDSVSMDITIWYKKLVESNHSVNETKAQQLKTGIRFMYFSLIIVCFVYFLKNIINLTF